MNVDDDVYNCDVIVRLMEEEGNAESLEGEKRKLEDKVDSLNGSIENLELHIQKVLLTHPKCSTHA